MMKKVLWPSVSYDPDVEEYFYIQDGAIPHGTDAALEFLEEKFQKHVIRRRSQRCWPARSKDL